MKKISRPLMLTIGIVIVVGAIVLLSKPFKTAKTKKSKRETVQIDPGFTNYISGFTSGIISSNSTIRIRFTENAGEGMEGEKAPKNVFKFQPSIKGDAVWVDVNTLEFKPDNPLKSGENYTATFALDKIIEVPEEYGTFQFNFSIIKQSFLLAEMIYSPYVTSDLKWNKLDGVLKTADYIDNDEVEKIISAKQENNKLSVRWIHDYDAKKHTFIVDSIQRKDEKTEVEITWDGGDSDIDVEGSKEIEIPGLNEFSLMSLRVLHQPDQHVLLSFSDPILKEQDLDGLIEIKGERKLTYTIENNQVKVFPQSRVTGDKKISISKHIKNSFGFKLDKNITEDLNFESLKPGVRLIGEGVILPNSNGLHMPFEAVNLNAIDVRVVKIFENNIAQFLQVNRLDGTNQMTRVGRLILNKKIELLSDHIIDYGRWNAFSIDLAELINTDPGAIYKVELGFKRSYSLYPCGDDNAEDIEIEEEDWDGDETEMSYWDGAEDYYSYEYYYDYDYDWSQRDNPCHKSYYTKNRRVSKNILASDLGIIAKAGTNNSVTVVVTDIITAKPKGNVDIEIYNYQQQLLGTAKTDNDGIAKIEIDNKAFLLVAKASKQRGYLKLDDGSSLALSKFDVGGQVVQKGIKGFIYGERGVWRPGDSIYLTFILSDKENSIPDQHPVRFELINPYGQTVNRIVKTQGVKGFYNFSTKTESDAPTGNWSARIQVGGAKFQKRIKIETVKPNRIRIDLDFGKEKLTRGNGYINGTLEAKWLHGAIAKDLNATIDLTLTSTRTYFNKYKDFIFDDPSRSFESKEYVLFDGSTGANGIVDFSSNISTGTNPPGMLKANFFTTVYEKGGDFSVNSQTLDYAPYNTFVGIKTPKGDKARGMLLTDKEHTVEVVTIDADENLKSVSGLRAEVYKVQWRWWWESSADNLGSYISRSNISPIVRKNVKTVDGFGNFTFEIKYPEWGRYLIRVISPDGHSTGKIVYIDWPGYAGRADRENPGGASMLTFSADKNKYSVGEKATLNIPSSEGSRIFVSIENGSKVLSNYWVEGQPEETSFQFNITEEMSPNIYVNVSLLQPHEQTINDLPIRLYGVIPLEVEDKATVLNPVLDVPDEVNSESSFEIKIKEEQGKEMTYTLAVVDEGLLGLTNFATPNPWSVFYAREALGVKTWDLYDYIIGAYGGNIEALFAIGGDEGLKGKKPEKANRFKPVVKFIGPFKLKRNGTNKHTIQLPQYIGAVRVMAIAGSDIAYGNTEKTITVKSPLMLLATLPRVLGPEEKVKLPVTLFTMDSKIKEAQVKVSANEYFNIEENTKQVSFGNETEKNINFDLAIVPKTGIGTVKVEATSGTEKATYDIEIDVRNPNPPVTKTYSTIIQPGETWEQTFEKIGIEGTNSAQLEVSCIPPVDFGRRLKYLIRYPHGCIEQTTSAALPQLFLSQVAELTDEVKDKTKENIEAAIDRLKKFQTSDGGFGYWPEATVADEWGSSYAGHFLLEAEKKGYDFPKDIKRRWVRYQLNRANNWSPVQAYYGSQHDLVQAYRLYTLALADEAEMGAMNRFREKENLSVQAKWRLAASYVLAGKPEVARELIAGLTTEIEAYSSYNSYTYGSSWRDRAMILETLVLLKDWDTASALLQEIAKQLSAQRWMSTHTTAYCLMSVAKVAGNSESVSKSLNFAYAYDDGSLTKVEKDNTISQHPYSYQGSSNSQVKVKNNAKSVIYTTLTLEGTPSTDDVTAYEKNLNMSISYFDLDGNSINPAKLTQGTEFKAVVKIHNPGLLGNYKNMALTQIFPSGWEISNTRLFDMESTQEADKPTYRDIRDDRIYTYFNISSRQTKHFVVVLTASYLGEFYLPSVYCEAMYDNSINAKKPGQWVKVVRPGE